MVPARHQLLILAASVVAGMICLLGSPVAAADDGSAGCTLLLSLSPVRAIGTFLVLMAVAGAVAVGVSRLLGPLTGIFVAGMGLAFPAIAGGGIRQLMASHDRLYWTLALETLLWAGLMLAVAFACLRWGRAASGEGGMTSGATFKSEPGTVVPKNLAMAAGFVVVCLIGPFLANVVLFPLIGKALNNQSVLIELMCTLIYFAALGYTIVWAAETVARGSASRHLGSWARFEPVAATVVGVVVGLSMASIWVRSDDPWQVAWSMVVSFAVAALWVRICFPGIGLIWALAVPMWASLVSYLVTAAAYPSNEKLLSALFSVDGPFIWRSSLAMPIFFASTGVAGACLGLGWFHAAMEDHGRQSAEAESGSQAG